jgi:DNA-binding protein H-NS
MARSSIESAKNVINTLLNEQERDRENLSRMLIHCEKMTEHLQMLRDEEEHRIDAEGQERKQALRKMFNQLISIEQERRDRLSAHIADLDGQGEAAAKQTPAGRIAAANSNTTDKAAAATRN